MSDGFFHDLTLLAPLLLQPSRDDRVRSIVSASYIEKHVTNMIRARLPGLTPALTNNLFKAERGPLGTLGAKIDIAEALQVWTPERASEARLVASIRNKFAHDLAIDNFDHPKVRDIVDKLQLGLGLDAPHEPFSNLSERQRSFALSSLVLCCEIMLENWRQFPDALKALTTDAAQPSPATPDQQPQNRSETGQPQKE